MHQLGLYVKQNIKLFQELKLQVGYFLKVCSQLECLKVLGDKLSQKLAQTIVTFWSFWKHHFDLPWLVVGNLLINLGYFLFQHLVTLPLIYLLNESATFKKMILTRDTCSTCRKIRGRGLRSRQEPWPPRFSPPPLCSWPLPWERWRCRCAACARPSSWRCARGCGLSDDSCVLKRKRQFDLSILVSISMTRYWSKK